MAREKVAVIEDDPDVLEVIEYNLKQEGFSVITARTGEEGLALVRAESPSVVLLDLMLEGIDGIEVCRELKQEADTRPIPVIMVTAKSEEADVVLGLGIGADDYVTKPFRPKELVARVKAVIRRGSLKEEKLPGKRIEHDGLVIDATTHEVEVDGNAVVLTPTEFRLLYILASNPGRVFSRKILVDRIIGENAVVIDRNIDVHVLTIRRKLGKRREMIQTVRGIGYRFQKIPTAAP